MKPEILYLNWQKGMGQLQETSLVAETNSSSVRESERQNALLIALFALL